MNSFGPLLGTELMDYGQMFSSLWTAEISAFQSVVLGQHHPQRLVRNTSPQAPSQTNGIGDSGDGPAAPRHACASVNMSALQIPSHLTVPQHREINSGIVPLFRQGNDVPSRQ